MSATGFDPHGKAVFTGRLFFAIGGIRGLFVPGHHSISFYWHLPHKARGPLAGYTAAGSPVSGMFNA